MKANFKLLLMLVFSVNIYSQNKTDTTALLQSLQNATAAISNAFEKRPYSVFFEKDFVINIIKTIHLFAKKMQDKDSSKNED